jgi:DNA-binding CsgD family transcriptional regulator
MMERRTIRIIENAIDNFDYSLIQFVIQEKTNDEIARKTGFSIGYIKRRLRFLFKLFKVKTKVGLVRETLKSNFVCSA